MTQSLTLKLLKQSMIVMNKLQRGEKQPQVHNLKFWPHLSILGGRQNN